MAELLNLNDVVSDALTLLPAEGEVEFNDYKAQLYVEYPEQGRDAFQHMLKKDMFKKRLDTSARPVKVYLSRK